MERRKKDRQTDRQRQTDKKYQRKVAKQTKFPKIHQSKKPLALIIAALDV